MIGNFLCRTLGWNGGHILFARKPGTQRERLYSITYPGRIGLEQRLGLM
jgi:hypothetical protein